MKLELTITTESGDVIMKAAIPITAEQFYPIMEIVVTGKVPKSLEPLPMACELKKSPAGEIMNDKTCYDCGEDLKISPLMLRHCEIDRHFCSPECLIRSLGGSRALEATEMSKSEWESFKKGKV